MAFEIQIRARETCIRCNGDGAIINPAWDEYYRLCETESIARGQTKPPEGPEEIDCPDCRGTGWREYWMTIKINKELDWIKEE